MKQKKILGLAMIFVFVMSISANSNIVVAQTNFVTTNFELSFFLPSGSRRDESYGLYIKQALAPLGIDVTIFAKPWGQYVGDLTHLSGGGKTWDLSTVGFRGGGLTPDLIGLYSSTGFWGSAIMQTNDPGFQAWQLAEVGLNQTTDIDALMEDVDFELDLDKRFDLLTEFNEMFFTDLLWNMPLVAPISKAAMWNGFGGPANELWDTKEGVVGSSFLGAKWEDANMASQRLGKTDNETLRVAVGDQGKFSLDPFQVVDTSQGTQTDWSYIGGFLSFDRDWAPRPNTAWNWIVSDGGTWDANQTGGVNGTAGTPDMVDTTKYTFLLRDDLWWNATKDMNGLPVAAQKVDGMDYNLTLTMYDMSRNTNLFDVNGIDTWEVLADWEITTTVFADDTISVRVPNSFRTPDDLISFGSLNPLPDHLLGGDLIYYNSTSELNETSPLEVGMPFNAWNTFQWNSFESFDGNTAIGPYRMVDYEFNIFHTFEERTDYWYPNEWFTGDYYTLHSGVTAVIDLEALHNMDLSLWGNGSYTQEAYYHAYAETTVPSHNYPTTQNLKTLEYVVIDDGNAALIKFEAGDIDWFGSTGQGATTVASHQNNPGMTVKDLFGNVSARNLYFNLLNEHLQKINVRRAVAQVLDRSKFVAIHDGFGIPWFSVAYPFKQSGGIDWDLIQHVIPYSYEGARDLMRLEEYQAADTNDFIPTADIPDVKDIIDVLGVDILTEVIGSNLLFLFTAFSMISVVLIKKRK